MLQILTLPLTLALASIPASLAPGPMAVEPAPAQCSVAALDAAPVPVPAAGGDLWAQACQVSEDCAELPAISCNGSTNCWAVARNCNVNQRGYVECDGNRTYCSQPCPPVCEDGGFRIVGTGTCCIACEGTELKEFQECQGGQWVTTGTHCMPNTSLCPLCP